MVPFRHTSRRSIMATYTAATVSACCGPELRGNLTRVIGAAEPACARRASAEAPGIELQVR